MTALLFCGAARAQLTPADLETCGARTLPSSARDTTLRGKQEILLEWRGVPQTTLAVLVREQDIDVSAGTGPAVSDSPVRRAGSQLLLTAASSDERLVVKLLGKELPGVRGRIFVTLHALPADDTCAAYLRQVSAGDREYAAAEALPAERAAHSRSAATSYAAAESLAARAHWPALAGHAQLAISASNYQGHNDWAGSQAAGLRAVTSFASAKKPYFEARAAGMAAAAMLENGSGATGADANEEARALLARAIEAFHAGGQVYDEALQRNNVGLSYLYGSDFPKCITESERAIPLFRQVGDAHRVALARQNVALCNWGLGRIRVASQLLEQAIPVLKTAPLPINYTTALNNGALAHYALGEFDRSIALHAEGERVARQFSMPRELAQSLYGLGVTYAAIGDTQTAQDYLKRALEIRTEAVDKRGRMSNLRALASLLDARGELAQADQMDRAALALAGTDRMRLRIELRIAQRSILAGAVTADLRQRLDTIVAGVPGGDSLSLALAQYLRGLIAGADGNAAVAHAEFAAAQKGFRDLEYVDDEFDVCLAGARLAHRQRDFPRAREAVDCAVRLADQMRAQILNPEIRANVGQLRREAADLELQISVDDPREPETRAARVLAIMERHRARLLDDYASVGLNAGADTAELRRLYDDLATARSVLADLKGRSSATAARAVDLRRQIVELRQSLYSAENRLRSVGRLPSRDYSVSREDFTRVPAETAIVEYWLGATRSFAVVLSRSGATVVELAATQILDRHVRELRTALSDASSAGEARRGQLMQELSRLAIAPLRFESGTKRILFIADGSLNYVPMAGLCMPGTGCTRSLVEGFEIASAPSAMRLLRPPARVTEPAKRVLIVADPVYQPTDARLGQMRLALAESNEEQPGAQIARLRSGATKNLRRLPGTATEAQLVAAKFPAHDVDLLLGLDATRDKVLAMGLEQYGVIHFAVHGLSDDEVPQLSALALSRYRRDGGAEDGRLWAGDLLQQRFKAELVFLSACDTALGPQFSGEGLVGLNFVLLSRGASNVISSLWPVEDVMTSTLVADVYARMRSGKTVLTALTDAQRAYLEGNKDRDIRKWAAWSAAVSGVVAP